MGNEAPRWNIVDTDVPVPEVVTPAPELYTGEREAKRWNVPPGVVQTADNVWVGPQGPVGPGVGISVKDYPYSAVGDGVANDTAAIQAAIDSLTDGGMLFFPTGTYMVDGLHVYRQGIIFLGESKFTTIIQLRAEATDLLTLGFDDSVYTNYSSTGTYNGTSYTYGGGIKIRDLMLAGPWPWTRATSTCRGIVDWEGGSITFDDVYFAHFGTAFWGVGSDVNQWRNVTIGDCVNGIVLNRKSDQNSFYDLYCYNCTQAVTLNDCSQNRFYAPIFAANVGADVVINADSSDFAYVAGSTNGYHVIIDGWFEAWSDGWQGTKHSFIDVNVAGDTQVNLVQIVRPFFAADYTGLIDTIDEGYVRVGRCLNTVIEQPMSGTPTADQNTFVYITDVHPFVQKVYMKEMFSDHDTIANWVVKEAGTTGLILTEQVNGSNVIFEGHGYHPVLEFRDPELTNAIRIQTYPNDGVISLFHGLPGVTADERVVLGTRRMKWGSAAPTTGTWTQGDIVFNWSPTAGGFIGWVCTAGGPPGTWNTFGAITP
jgi:hypothetical protein